MLKVLEDNTIYLTQGDTLDVTVSPVVINTLGEEVPYEPQIGDSMRFAITSKFGAEPIFVIDISMETMRLRVESESTKLLKARTKPYFYDVELTQADGTVCTFIDRAKLYSTEEVV